MSEVQVGDTIVEVNGLRRGMVEECMKLKVLVITFAQDWAEEEVVSKNDALTEAKRSAMFDCIDKLKGNPTEMLPAHEISECTILSVGDSLTERNALKHLLSQQHWPLEGPVPTCKTLTLLQEPSPADLGIQLRLLLLW